MPRYFDKWYNKNNVKYLLKCPELLPSSESVFRTKCDLTRFCFHLFFAQLLITRIQGLCEPTPARSARSPLAGDLAVVVPDVGSAPRSVLTAR